MLPPAMVENMAIHSSQKLRRMSGAASTTAVIG